MIVVINFSKEMARKHHSRQSSILPAACESLCNKVPILYCLKRRELASEDAT